MSVLAWLAVCTGAILWIGFAAFAAWITRAPVRGGEFAGQFLYRLLQTYSRLMHRVRAEGLEHVPLAADGTPAEPLIIVANHTAGIDPLLIQAVLPFEVRWIMAADMRVRALDALWDYAGVIFVDRQGGEGHSIRAALRHLRDRHPAGPGVIGVFPEGHIERPPRELLAFQEGIGMLAAKGRARVLPVLIDGAPYAQTAWGSLLQPSRSRVRVLPPIDYRETSLKPGQIAADLQRRFADATGWPATNRAYIFENGEWIETRAEPSRG